jgi:WD40 repeat protein/serine/threonine protein kinase
MPVDVARLKSLFLVVSDLPDPDERAGYLDRECGADRELRQRVEALLQAHDGAPLAAPVQSSNSSDGRGDSAEFQDAAKHLGQILAGKYKLIEVIGQGGMGSVFLAQQTEPVQRSVAVKLIKPGMDSKGVLARFEAERQALAVMDHPNIAKILDAGLHENRPFFVMELVKGTPITKFCDARRLNPQERLRLFIPVCHAIQHAHQKGIIHRDIKPSNVLIALYDDRPVPKVIDFGVAKAAGHNWTEVSIHTGFGALVGTPEYMSPEQASLNNLDVDTRTDVYALGALLYELLTGTPPFRKQELDQRGLLEILRVIREEEPLRPSAQLSTTDGLAGIAASRNSDAAGLMRVMKGDLDWIVMKALEKDRARRYDTANGMARDIERYLADEVIDARPPSAGYRLRKLMHRNRGRVVAAGLILLACLAGTIGTAMGMIQARQQREIAEEQRTIAVENSLIAERAAQSERQRSEDLAVAMKSLERERQRAEETALQARERSAQLAQALKQVEAGREETELSLANNHLHLAEAAFHGSSDVVQAKGWLAKIPERFRKWEWQYLNRKYEGGYATLRGHTKPVTSVVFSPEGRRFASASGDGTIRIWEARTGNTLRELKGHSQEVTSLAISSDGRVLVSGSRDRAVRLWDVATGTTLAELTGHQAAVRCVAISPDGRRIASGGDDKTIRIWDAASGEMLRQIVGGTKIIIEGARESVRSVAFSPDGLRLAEGSYDGQIRLWNVETGKLSNRFESMSGFPVATCVTFSPDGTHLAASFEFGAIRVWNLRTGKLLPELIGHTRSVTCIAFSSDGTQLASASQDKTIRVWDVQTAKSLLELVGHTGAVTSVDFHPDGTHLVSGSEDQTIRLWDAKTGQSAVSISVDREALYVSSVAFSPDGGRVAGGVFNAARIWEVTTGRKQIGIAASSMWEDVKCVRFTPDGRRLIGAKMYATRGSCDVWNAETGETLVKLATTEPTTCVAVSPDGARLATSGWGTTIRLWDARTGTNPRVLTGHTQTLKTLYEVASVNFSPDGQHLASGSADKTVRIWDVQTGGTQIVLNKHTDSVLSVAYSPDGALLASGSADKTIRIWDPRDGQPLLELMGHRYAVNSVCFSPDGSRLASGSADKTIRIWDTATGRFLIELKGHSAPVSSVCFSPDGTRLASAGGRTIFVWDSRTGEQFPPEEELVFRRAMSRSDPIWHQDQLLAAQTAHNTFGTQMQNYLIRRATSEEHFDEQRLWQAWNTFWAAAGLRPKTPQMDWEEIREESK